jgi:hypothetical protein
MKGLECSLVPSIHEVLALILKGEGREKKKEITERERERLKNASYAG